MSSRQFREGGRGWASAAPGGGGVGGIQQRCATAPHRAACYSSLPTYVATAPWACALYGRASLLALPASDAWCFSHAAARSHLSALRRASHRLTHAFSLLVSTFMPLMLVYLMFDISYGPFKLPIQWTMLNGMSCPSACTPPKPNRNSHTPQRELN